MATELGLLSQNLQKLAQQKQQQRHQLSMWNYTSHRPTIDDDDSWEVRAFAEDTTSAMGTTWPPRSYTCTFCQREFRSAQALGGHMNVHRRDRARLQQFPQGSNPSPSSIIPGSSSPMVFSSPEFITSGGLCLFYPIPHPGSASTSATADLSTLLSITPYPGANFPVASPHAVVPLLDKVGMTRDINVKDNGYASSDNGVVDEGMDLELRLGW